MLSAFKSIIRQALQKHGYRIVRSGLKEPNQSHAGASYDNSVLLPAGAADYLRKDNPRLMELKQRYAALRVPMGTHSHWNDQLLQRDLEMNQFRGDNVYVWQLRNVREHARMKYFLFAQYIAARDPAGLLQRLGEDGQFGAWTFQYQGWPLVSRDLLDSINEIYFLDRHIGLLKRSGLRILDIGAGYGRMAHRMLQAAPSIQQYDCLDAIPESTFLCEYYLRYRDLNAKAVPLDHLDAHYEQTGHFDLAMNIHSFSEMSYAAIEGWLSLLSRLKPKHLLIVPNTGQTLLSSEADQSRRDCTNLLRDAGYQLKVSEPIFLDANVREMMAIDDYLTLYERI